MIFPSITSQGINTSSSLSNPKSVTMSILHHPMGSWYLRAHWPSLHISPAKNHGFLVDFFLNRSKQLKNIPLFCYLAHLCESELPVAGKLNSPYFRTWNLPAENLVSGGELWARLRPLCRATQLGALGKSAIVSSKSYRSPTFGWRFMLFWDPESSKRVRIVQLFSGACRVLDHSNI